jgi:hypothetical protein
MSLPSSSLPRRAFVIVFAGAVVLAACASAGSASDDPLDPGAIGGSGDAGGDSSAGSSAAGGESSMGGESSTGGGATEGGSGGAASGAGGASGTGGHAGEGVGGVAGAQTTGGAGGTAGGGGAKGGASGAGGATSGSGGVAGSSKGGGGSGVGGASGSNGVAGASGASAGGAGGASGGGASGAGGMPPVLAVDSIVPADGATSVSASTTIALTFNASIDGTSVSNATSGACSGTVQLSCDDFADCLATTISVAGAVVTITPTSPLPAGATCKVHVTSAATSTGGAVLSAGYDSAGFTVASGGVMGCSGAPVVISQIYGGGGDSGSTYENDFIELFNRSGAAVSLAGWSVQYAAASGSTWQATALSGSIAAGGYYLVVEAAGAGGTKALPKADATGVLSMGAKAGQVALVNQATALASGSCPMPAKVIDVVPYGTVQSCLSTPAPSATSAVLRAGAGCTVTGDPGSDFMTGAPNPRNSATPAASCTLASCD